MSHRPQVSVDVGSPRVSLAIVVERLQRRAEAAELENATAPVANVYRLVIADLVPLLDGTTPADSPAPETTRLLTADELAAVLRCSRKWVYRHIDRLPFARRVGRSIRFDFDGLQVWLRGLR